MNLSLTPIDEAWNVQKSKHSSFNKFSQKATQQEILSASGYGIATSEPEGYSGKDFAPHKSQQPSPSPEPPTDQPTSPAPTTSMKTLTIEINDPKLIQSLKPYTNDYIQEKILKALSNEVEKPETFIGKPEISDNGLIIIVILILLAITLR